MKNVKVFADTNIINRILDINNNNICSNTSYKEDRLFLSKIMSEYVDQNIIEIFVNPTIKREIENTSDCKRKNELLLLLNKFHYTNYNKTIFPFTFPATFLTKEEKTMLQKLRSQIKDFEKDEKVFLDAVSNSQVNVLLTTDRKHLACMKLKVYITHKMLDVNVKIFTPKEFYEYLKKV